jgi:hypothetical protein
MFVKSSQTKIFSFEEYPFLRHDEKRKIDTTSVWNTDTIVSKHSTVAKLRICMLNTHLIVNNEIVNTELFSFKNFYGDYKELFKMGIKYKT